MNGPAACWHCGEPLPTDGAFHARVAGAPQPVCCRGCLAAAEWIDQLGLGDYYRLRTQPGRKPRGHDDSAAWQRPEIARDVVRDLGNGQHEVMLLIDGISCTGCVWLIERSLTALPGVGSVSVNAAARRARVTWRENEVQLPEILRALTRTGYGALPLNAKSLDDVRRRESRTALKRLLVAAFGSMQAMMFAAVLYLGGAPLDSSTSELFRWLGCLVATPVVFYSARPFFGGAIRALRSRQLGMDMPVAIAITLIYAASLLETWRGGGHVYFDSVSMFVFFLLAGRYVEMRARHRAGDLTDALARVMPPFAERRRPDGGLDRVGIHELAVGDCVHVADGGAIPADGVLLSEVCRIDEALLSGESAPRLRRRGERVIAGSVLVEGSADLRVDRTGAATTIAGIAALVERALTQRPRLACVGERAAARFVARVLALAAVTVIGWSLVDPPRAFTAALAVLVVSCPCAFALAVPAAITRALAVLARRGVLVVNPDAIEALATATHAIFDKTGTLTEPDLALADIESRGGSTRDAVLNLAAALARESRHPVARAIVQAHRDGEVLAATEVDTTSGLGISACVDGRRFRLGRADFALAGLSMSVPPDTLVLADDVGLLAAFRLGERLRRGAQDAVAALQAQGLHVAIASGDTDSKVRSIAAALRVTEWRSGLRPADKLAWLETLRSSGARVIAIGDGFNDAPVLAGADVAIALAGSSELAQASSDVVIAGERLEAIAPARSLAQQTLAILAQNHRWALVYNLTAMPLAALGFVPPWLAALGMSASSLAVVLNSQRIGRGADKRHTDAPVVVRRDSASVT